MNVYQRAAIAVRDRRTEAIDNARIALDEAMRTNDALFEAYKAYQKQMIAAAQNQKNELEKARALYNAQLEKAGFTRDFLDPPYFCEKCRDTGYINGKYCPCVIRSVINSDKANLSLKPLNLDKAEKSAPNAAIKKAYEQARQYVESFPGGKKPFFVLVGSPGAGKTVLARAAVGAMMEKGASAVTITAFDFVRRALDYHTQFSIPDYTDRFTPVLDCDILLIDDLGTESMLKNVTREYLYTTINQRYVDGKYTIVTTNLKPDELNNRYGESIFSRMCDKSRAVNILINAKNARFD